MNFKLIGVAAVIVGSLTIGVLTDRHVARREPTAPQAEPATTNASSDSHMKEESGIDGRVVHPESWGMSEATVGRGDIRSSSDRALAAEPVPPAQRRLEFHSSMFSMSDYASYEEQSLRQLAEGGDVAAMQVLAMKIYTGESSNGSIEEANRLMREAAVAGASYYPFSTRAEQIGYELELALSGQQHTTEEETTAMLVDTLTYARLAEMRGNPALLVRWQRRLADNYGIEPSEEEWKRIRTRADEEYRELIEQRMAAGFGPFDS